MRLGQAASDKKDTAAERTVDKCGSTFHLIFRLFDLGVLGGDVSTESPDSTTDDDLSKFVASEFTPDADKLDVGIKVGEFGEEVPRRGPEEESRSVLEMVADRVVTEFGTIFEDDGGIELLNVGDDTDRDIRVWTTLEIDAGIGGGIGGGTFIGADKDDDIREGAGCLVKGGCRIREKGLGRTVPGARSGPVEGIGGCRDKPCDSDMGRVILDCGIGWDGELLLANCGLDLNVQSSWGGCEKEIEKQYG